jgi:hypothetical protein
MREELIATREYAIVDADGNESPLSIQLFKPVPDGEDWRCMAVIHEMGNVWPHSVVGIDALQALNLAIELIKSEVGSFQKRYQGGLRLFDQKEVLWL